MGLFWVSISRMLQGNLLFESEINFNIELSFIAIKKRPWQGHDQLEQYHQESKV